MSFRLDDYRREFDVRLSKNQQPKILARYLVAMPNVDIDSHDFN